MKKAFNRLLALLLTMLLVVNASGITVFAADTGNELPAGLTPEGLQQDKQIIDGWLEAENGALGTETIKSPEGEWNKTPLEKVQVSKTIAPTGFENEFAITLTVKTKENLKEKIYAPDAAVTLVMDISASMSQCAICGKGYHDYIDHDFIDDGGPENASPYLEHPAISGDGICDYPIHDWGAENGMDDMIGFYEYCGQTADSHQKHAFKERIEAAKESALSFIENLIKNTPKDENGDYLAHRWVSLVSFSDSAKEECGWKDITTSDGYNAVMSAINGLEPNFGAKPNPTPKSDGTYTEVPDAPENVDPSKNYQWGTEGTGGTNICDGLQAATGLMTDTDASVDISGLDNKYTVLLSDGMPSYYIDDDGTVVGEGMEKDTPTDYKYCSQTAAYANNLKGQSESKLYSICFCEARKVCYTDEEGKETKVVDLLTDMSDACYTAEDAKKLHEVFEGIAELLTLLTKAWIVTDPMGSNIEFGGIVENDIGGTPNVQFTDNELHWDLSNEPPVKTPEGENGGTKTYTYQLKYKIKLDNLGNDFVEKSPYATNGYTDLTYTFLKIVDGEEPTRVDENGKPVASSAALDHIGFNVPQVQGYLGELTFRKVGPSGEPIKGAVFTLTLNESGKPWEQTATSGSDGTVTFKCIPSGHEYTLTETKAPEGYEAIEPLTVKVSYGEVKVEGEGVDTVDGVYTVTDPYALGSLTIKKNVKVDEKGKIDNIIGEGRDFTFTVQADKNLKGKFGKINGEDVEFTDGKAEVTVTVTVGEDGNASGEATIEDLPVGTYTVTENTEGAEVEGYTLVVNENGSVEKAATVTENGADVAFTNTYTLKLGSLTITKTVVDGGADVDGKTYTFDITGPNYTKTVTLTAGQSETLNVLVPGEYTVTEQNADIEGYTLDVSGGGSVTVEAEKEATASVTNKYTQKLGSLKITKTVSGGGAEAAGKEYKFDVEGPDGYRHTVTITGNGSETLSDLVPGEYTVTEQNADIGGYTLVVTGDTTATVVADETATATITNKYTQKLGSLKITKEVKGGGDEAATKEYTFDITGPNDYNNTVTITGAGTAQLNDLVPGEYTITERDASIDGYTLAVVNGVTATVAAEQITDVTVTNTYTKIEGSLLITKNVNGGGAEAAGKTYTFDITGPDGYTNTVTITGAGTTTLDNLPLGEYTVTERAADIDGWNLTVSSNGTVTVEITEDGQTETVAFTNTYTQKLGSLTITKTVEGGPAAAATNTYTFTVSGPSYPDGTTVTVSGNGSETLENLVPGEYTITEVGADIEGYTLTTTGGGSVTVEAEKEATASVTNTYTPKPGSLKITKMVDGGGEEAANKTYTFTVTGQNYSNTVTITGNGSETIEGLVPGMYTVTEQNAEIEGYTLEVTGGGNVTVEAEKTATASITNTYTQKLGSLTITKTVEGGPAAAATNTYTFTVTGPNYANTVTLTAGASTTINDLVPGTYTVTEQDASIEGYDLDVTGEGNVTVVAEQTAEVTVTNKYTQKLGSLTITKSVVGGGAEAAGKTYTFTIEGPEGSNYSETVTLTAGASETLEGLVPGTYTVTEQDANIDGYTLEVDGTGDVTVEADGNVEVTVTNTYTTVETNPVETDPVETDPVETDPVETEPEETEPVETEPEETEPEETEPVETEPVETEPVETEPVETEPVETEPEETEPVETEPVETEPVETEPVETEPEETEPVETDPVETEPVETEPVIIPETTGPEPVVTEPAETEPETEIPEPDVPLDDISNEPAPAADVPSTEPPYEEIPDPDVPLVDIPDQFVPMTDIPSIEPPYEDIPDADIPLAEEAIPTTGDISRRSLWTGLMSISGLGIMGMIAAILADRKKSKKEDKD